MLTTRTSWRTEGIRSWAVTTLRSVALRWKEGLVDITMVDVLSGVVLRSDASAVSVGLGRIVVSETKCSADLRKMRCTRIE